MQIIVNRSIVNYEFLENKQSDRYILILPGWMRPSLEWLSIANLLKDSFNIVIVDFPGFGITPKPTTDFDIYDYANHVKSFLEKLDVKKCIVLGHSFGGRVAIILAATTNIVDKLILVDSAGLNIKNTNVQIKQFFFPLVKSFYKVLPKKLVFKLRTLIGSDDYNNAGEMKNTLIKVVNQNLVYLLKQIHSQTLIIWGNKDDQVSVNKTKIFKNEISDSQVRIVWGAGHSPHLEKSVKFVEILKEFVC